jgi:hypothetical protein
LENIKSGIISHTLNKACKKEIGNLKISRMFLKEKYRRHFTVTIFLKEIFSFKRTSVS